MPSLFNEIESYTTEGQSLESEIIEGTKSSGLFDEIENYTAPEEPEGITWGEVLKKAPASGLAHVNVGLARLARDTIKIADMPASAVRKAFGIEGERPDVKFLEDYMAGEQKRQEVLDVSEEISQLPHWHPKRIIGTGLQAVPQVAAVAGGALMGAPFIGGATSAATMLGAIAYGPSAEEAKAEGATEIQQVLHGITSAQIEVLTELPVFKAVGQIWRHLKGAGVAKEAGVSFAKRLLTGLGLYGKGLALETVQEVEAYLGGQLSKRLHYDPNATINFKDAVEAGYGGLSMAATVGIAGVPGMAVKLAGRRGEKPSAARKTLLDEDEQDAGVTAKELLTGEKEEPSFAIDTFTGAESLDAEEAAAISDEQLEDATSAVTEPKVPTAPRWLNDLTDNEISKRIDNFETTQAARGLSEKQTQNLGMLQQELENRGLPAKEAKIEKPEITEEKAVKPTPTEPTAEVAREPVGVEKILPKPPEVGIKKLMTSKKGPGDITTTENLESPKGGPKIVYDDLPDLVDGYFDDETNTIYVSKKLSPELAKKTIRHELEHTEQAKTGTLPTSKFVHPAESIKHFMEYFSDPHEVSARAAETGEEIPEIWNEVFKLREKAMRGETGIESLSVEKISPPFEQEKIIPDGYVEGTLSGWHGRRLSGTLRSNDPKPVKKKVRQIRVYLKNKGNGIEAEDVLNDAGIKAFSNAPYSVDVVLSSENLVKISALFGIKATSQLPKPSSPPKTGGQNPPAAPTTPAKPLSPKPPKAKPPEAVTDEIKGEVIPKIDWKYNELHKKDFATPAQTFWDWYERQEGAKWLKKEHGITLDKSQKGEWYLARKAKVIPEVKPKVEKEKVEVTPEKKEPWKITRGEYVKQYVEEQRAADFPEHMITDKYKESIMRDHFAVVSKAFAEGKTIPPDVLKDYPDLKAEEKIEIETTPEGKEISKLDLTKRYVRETGEKIKEGEVYKVKEKYPEEWEKIDKAEKYKKSLWDKLPEDFRSHFGINQYTTKELKDMVAWEDLTLDEFEKIPLKERGQYPQLPKSVREERLETERWAEEQDRKKKEAKAKRAEKKAEASIEAETGTVWIKNVQKPILSARKIARGKNKGKYEVVLTKGRDAEGNIAPGLKKIVAEDAIIKMPLEKPAGVEPLFQKRTTSFKDWFGDSKVVNEKGEPLVVYHGTIADFDVFKDIGETTRTVKWGKNTFFFSDNPDLASDYAEQQGLGANVLPTYLSIKNPLIVDAKGKGFGFILKPDLVKNARKEGYDGIVVENVLDRPSSREDYKTINTVYVAFEPTQIKSATANIGTFDPKNPDIRFTKRATAASIGTFKAPDLQSQIDKITSRWKNSPIVEIVQHQTALPEGIKQYVKKGDIVDGVYYHGKVHIVADNMASTEIAVKTLLHESFGHYGLRGMLGNDFSKIMRDVYLAKRTEVQKIADEYEYDIKTEKGKVLSAEEWMAREAVNNPTSGWVKRVMIAIRKFARRLMPSLRLSDAEIYQIIEDARDYVVRGRPRMSDGLGAYFGVPGYQSAGVAEPFYSQVIKAVEQKFPAKMNARSIANWIQKQGGKPVELEWLGLDEWLEGKKIVTKDELSEFLRANQVEVREVALGKIDRQEEKAMEAQAAVTRARREQLPTKEIERLREIRDKLKIYPATKFGKWQLPGGENYKELLLTLPSEKTPRLPENWDMIETSKGVWQVDKEGKGDPSASIPIEATTKMEAIRKYFEEYPSTVRIHEGKEFISPHYDEPNILAHVRFNERTDAEGNKVLFLEEVQSDWALKGRQEGYKVSEADLKKVGIRAITRGTVTVFIDNKNRLITEGKVSYIPEFEEIVKPTPKQSELIKGYTEATTPDMPFKENWYQVTLKRMLRYASENGFSKMAWISGEQTADRYDLSKQINIVQWDHNADGTFDISAIPKDLATESIEKKGISRNDLENLIGKEITSKIVDHKGQTYKAPDGATASELKGLDLKVGGEWATQLYNRMIPQYLKKFGKKWGAKIGTTDIDTTGWQSKPKYIGDNYAIEDVGKALVVAQKSGPSIFESPITGERQIFAVNRVQITNELKSLQKEIEGGTAFSDAIAMQSNATAELFGGKIERIPQKATVPSITITPEMKQSALRKGMPLFQMAGEKAVPEIKIIGQDKSILNRISPEVSNFLKTMSAMDVYIVPRTMGKYGYVGRGMQDRPQDIHIGPKALKDDAELNATIFHEALHQIESGRWKTSAAMAMKAEWESFDWKSKSPKELRELGFGDTLWLFRKTKVKALKSGEFFAEMGEYYLERPKILKKQAKPIFDFFEKHMVEETKMFSTEGDDIQFSKRKPAEPSFQETLEPIVQEDYIANRKTNKNIKLTIVTNTKRVASEIVEGVDKFLGAISTRLGNVSPGLRAKLRRLDFDINTKYAKDVKKVEPLLIKAKKMALDDIIDWDYARKNSDIAKIHGLVSKYDMQKEYAAYREILGKVREEGLDVGLEIGEIEEYAPRILKDQRGFLKAIGKPEYRPLYSDKLEEWANDLGMTVESMHPDMKADIVSNIILGGWTGLGGVPATKHRILKKIPADLNKYYMDSDAALMQHLYGMRKLIEAQKFFGKIPKKVAEMRKRLYAMQTLIRTLNSNMGGKLSKGQISEMIRLKKSIKDGKLDDKQLTTAKRTIKALENVSTDTMPDKQIATIRKNRNKYIGLEKEYTAYIAKYALQRDYTENIGAYIIELIENKEISPKHEQVVNEILSARFHEHGTHGVIQAYKNMSYIDTMGSPISALTQIGDFAWPLFEYGVPATLKHAYRSVVKRSKITRADVGVDRIAQEFADSGALGDAVSTVFKMVGLEQIDAIGKETLLNAALEDYQNQAKNNPAKLKREIRSIFEAETDSVIDDLVNDEISDNVKLLTYSKLLDFQPVGLSEMTQQYLTAGNGRLFYMLKTFTLKQFDIFRRVSYNKIVKGDKAEKIQGLKNLVKLSMIFVLANAGADELKDWVLGRKTDFSDRMVDNILRLFGVSKFVTWKARTEGVGSALTKQILFPVKFIDSAGKDIITAGDEKGLEVIGSIPVIGKLAYWHMGRGRSKREDLWNRRLRKRKSKLNKIKDRLDIAKDKRAFESKHAGELSELRKINKLQGRLNEKRKRINKLKGLQETVARKKEIQRLEVERTNMIKKFLTAER